MSADVLRRAAALMRERAEAANEGPWVSERIVWNSHYEIRSTAGTSSYALGTQFVSVDAEHIASWHPEVALAVADWLDATADRHDDILSNFAEGSRAGAVTAAENVTAYQQALTVARAYLGEQS